MKISRLLLPAVALAGAAALVLPTATRAYTFTGDVLDIPVRDFRVYNNFSDPEANDNTTPHPDFPGHTGVVMAIWKASVEWGSRRHGAGEGDPSQQGDLGSGGANFDASFQGLASGVGGMNDNVHSEISGCGGGVIGVVASHGGTRITLPLPAGAQPGDVLVRAPFAGYASLSNAWPFDPSGSGCPPPASYCVGAPNSVGAGARMSWIGSTSVASNDLELQTVGLPPAQFGLFYYGPNQIQVPFGDGFRCVGGGVYRLGVKLSGSGGTVSCSLDITAPPSPPGQITAGSTWNFQLWYRDPAGPGGSGFNFSDGLNANFCN